MTETITPGRVTRRARAAPPYVLAAIAWLACALPMLHHFEDQPRTELEVLNDTAWTLTLYVRTERATSPIMSIGRGRARATTEVIVPGETWHFVWRFAGDD